MNYELGKTPQPIDEAMVCEIFEGPKNIDPAYAESIMQMAENRESLVDSSAISNVVEGLTTPNKIDPYKSVIGLGCSADTIATLLASNTGVIERYRLFEHTQAVLHRFDSHPSNRMVFAADELKVLRTTLLLQDIGKPLAVAASGSKRDQSAYNLKIATAIIGPLSVDVLSEDAKQLIALLINQDIIGSAVRKKVSVAEAQRTVEYLRSFCPAIYAKRLNTYLGAIYLADATAYTWYGRYRDTAGNNHRCLPALNMVFKRLDSGEMVFRRRSQQLIYNSLINT